MENSRNIAYLYDRNQKISSATAFFKVCKCDNMILNVRAESCCKCSCCQCQKCCCCQCYRCQKKNNKMFKLIFDIDGNKQQEKKLFFKISPVPYLINYDAKWESKVVDNTLYVSVPINGTKVEFYMIYNPCVCYKIVARAYYHKCRSNKFMGYIYN